MMMMKTKMTPVSDGFHQLTEKKIVDDSRREQRMFGTNGVNPLVVDMLNYIN
jgi:hypothetical protein